MKSYLTQSYSKSLCIFCKSWMVTATSDFRTNYHTAACHVGHTNSTSTATNTSDTISTNNSTVVSPAAYNIAASLVNSNALNVSAPSLPAATGAVVEECLRENSILFLLLMLGTVWAGLTLFNFTKTWVGVVLSSYLSSLWCGTTMWAGLTLFSFTKAWVGVALSSYLSSLWCGTTMWAGLTLFNFTETWVGVALSSLFSSRCRGTLTAAEETESNYVCGSILIFPSYHRRFKGHVEGKKFRDHSKSRKWLLMYCPNVNHSPFRIHRLGLFYTGAFLNIFAV